MQESGKKVTDLHQGQLDSSFACRSGLSQHFRKAQTERNRQLLIKAEIHKLSMLSKGSYSRLLHVTFRSADVAPLDLGPNMTTKPRPPCLPCW